MLERVAAMVFIETDPMFTGKLRHELECRRLLRALRQYIDNVYLQLLGWFISYSVILRGVQFY